MQLLKLEGFLNMPFGSEKEFVLDSLKKRGGIVEEEISTNESVFLEELNLRVIILIRY